MRLWRHLQRTSLLAAMTIVASIAVGSVPSVAATWEVSKDGSGDFSIIQDAVDVAAPGDTVLIGAGRYTEFKDFQLDCCNVMPTYVGIPIEDLTIIGVHRDSVIIGPDVTTHQETIVGMRMGSSGGFKVQNLTLQQGTYGMRVTDSARIENLRFRDCWIGSFTYPDEYAVFEACLFERCRAWGIAAGSGSRNVSVRGCAFVDNASSINFTWSYNPSVDRCTFVGSGTTRIVAAGLGVALTVTNCTIEGGENASVGVLDQAKLTLLDTRITTLGGTTVLCQSADGFEARRNHLEGGWGGVLWFSGQQKAVTISQNTIVKGSGFAVMLSDYPAFLEDWKLDLPNNYWNTTEIDSVRAWIWDGMDDPELHGFVKVAPILPLAPVPVEEQSTGGLKSLFRRR